MIAVGPFWTEAGGNEIDAVALAGRGRRPAFAGEAKWSRRVEAGRIVAGLQRKVEALPGADADPILAVCAREQVRGLPEGVRAVTATDIFS